MPNKHLDSWSQEIKRKTLLTQNASTIKRSGKIIRSTGMILEAVGLNVPVGSVCHIVSNQKGRPSKETTRYAEAEVVGFSEDRLFLMPLEDIHGLGSGALVYPSSSDESGDGRQFPLGYQLLGRVVDGGGQPLDDKGPLDTHITGSLGTDVLNPLKRAPIDTQIDVGVRAINGLLSIGRGQRMGLFAGSGVGKSMLLGMMSRYTNADVIVVGLIGERGREVQDFIDNILGEEGMRRAVVVAAPADTSPLKRLQGAAYSTRLAEYFRDEGKNVLLIMDSLTRYAMAQREIALAIGEPPATKGYPPSVFAKLPKLVERAGNGPVGGGSITAFYTVLTEGDDQQDPIADSARAILDGHIVLSRELAESGHYPAIDVEASISRVMTAITDATQQMKAIKLKQLLSSYERNRDLINVGAYTKGRDPLLDQAVQMYPVLERFLHQQVDEKSDLMDTLNTLNAIL